MASIITPDAQLAAAVKAADSAMLEMLSLAGSLDEREAVEDLRRLLTFTGSRMLALRAARLASAAEEALARRGPR